VTSIPEGTDIVIRTTMGQSTWGAAWKPPAICPGEFVSMVVSGAYRRFCESRVSSALMSHVVAVVSDAGSGVGVSVSVAVSVWADAVSVLDSVTVSVAVGAGVEVEFVSAVPAAPVSGAVSSPVVVVWLAACAVVAATGAVIAPTKTTTVSSVAIVFVVVMGAAI
jgi:hypothetical protein